MTKPTPIKITQPTKTPNSCTRISVQTSSIHPKPQTQSLW